MSDEFKRDIVLCAAYHSEFYSDAGRKLGYAIPFECVYDKDLIGAAHRLILMNQWDSLARLSSELESSGYDIGKLDKSHKDQLLLTAQLANRIYQMESLADVEGNASASRNMDDEYSAELCSFAIGWELITDCDELINHAVMKGPGPTIFDYFVEGKGPVTFTKDTFLANSTVMSLCDGWEPARRSQVAGRTEAPTSNELPIARVLGVENWSQLPRASRLEITQCPPATFWQDMPFEKSVVTM